VLQEELDRTTDPTNQSERSRAFLRWGIKQISPSLSYDDIRSAVTEEGKDKGIDGAWFDKSYRDRPRSLEGAYFVAQSKCPEDLRGSTTFGPEPAEQLHKGLVWLTSDSAKPVRPELQNIRDQLTDLTIGQGYSGLFVVLIAGVASDDLKDYVKNLNQELRDLHRGKLSFEIYDAKRLYNLYISNLEAGDTPPPAQVEFRFKGEEHRFSTEDAQAIVVDVPLSEITKLVRKHDLALFSRNLRVPLLEAPRNIGIRATIGDDAERPHFWLYNNGITAICESFKVTSRDEDPEDVKVVLAEKMQIVNGCQTSYMIAQVAREWERAGIDLTPLQNASVLMRVIKVPPRSESGLDLAHRIAKYTNSQTPVDGRDLHSTDFEQARLKQAFERDWNLFLEVKKKEWDRRLERDRTLVTKFDKPRPITNLEVAQAFVAFWESDPVFATASTKKLFEDDARYNRIFDRTFCPEALLMPVQLWYILDQWKWNQGYTRRRESERKAPRVTKASVAKYAGLIIIGILGISLKRRQHIIAVKDVDSLKLRHYCANLRRIYLDYYNLPKSYKPLGHELDDSFEDALKLVFQYSKLEMDKDPELTLRNLWIRPSTWPTFTQANLTAIESIGPDLPARLGTRIG